MWASADWPCSPGGRPSSPWACQTWPEHFMWDISGCIDCPALTWTSRSGSCEWSPWGPPCGEPAPGSSAPGSRSDPEIRNNVMRIFCNNSNDASNLQIWRIEWGKTMQMFSESDCSEERNHWHWHWTVEWSRETKVKSCVFIRMSETQD